MQNKIGFMDLRKLTQVENLTCILLDLSNKTFIDFTLCLFF